MTQSIVAVFTDRNAANRAVQALQADGIPQDDISVRTGQEFGGPSPIPGTRTTEHEQGRGFLSWLFGSNDSYDVPERHQEKLYQGVREEGQAVVIVKAGDSHAEYDRVNAILDGYDPLSIDDDDGGAATERSSAREGETVLPVVEEKMAVGKRQVRRANAYRVRTTVEKVPVEKDVTLRDERAVVERRPVSGRAPDGDAFREQTVEVHEMHEEPVVQKTAEQTEEVVVRKDVDEHVEKVRDNVRRTRVEVDGDAQKNPRGNAGRRNA